ncbi:riboflavin biosynthesis protein RibBA [Clostridium pasteurianum DSM 525 = ATCC 6013]|uniref:Riboflavin biosynthesis protein RibBA n=1 Tax=Clostridium pasteurianum DSM 525 = ATCC 6013 TaxID=1262449 RepID=A0A0H3J2V6_CLOPA|nr:bifunctional 3,4-dihydroxy-2-butanone-4-phosphate synthase/GTP cyclohydrolase II [Clostridium pasteurianum]AJA46248.1 riboflavin biosynthesis protein RibBA [Clostridium pasteurianum DSM 525 = ATCC 6013]AJA50236.1 riboflavin biosynthesis protein RibBA [Clostridium pasteurianum DSM 525 = ATCC 6013]AOZ73701.1 3,4-dihydroxy-2-butanone 4-phosphate synthase [Clostridium pasteurianum DSM 525 = ATCC 6013]AOZ77498.1 3,4-dihydroxy-2-butanone 4-phosphate synthase [Clostridium pasteurianum]ELP60832.1 r
MYKFNTIEEAIEDIKEGKMIVVVDDEDRENEGDLIIASEKVTPEAINFMAKYAGGLICTPIVNERLKELNIGLMVEKNTESHNTAFTVSIDGINTTTGISAYDRAETILQLINPSSKAEDFRRPGHVFPLAAKPNGVLERTGHTEAAVDLAKLAGLYPAGTICEIMNEDGSMARLPQLMEYVKKHNLKIITVADLVEYRKANEILIKVVSEANMPTKYGDFKIIGYENSINGDYHIALVKGDISSDSEAPLVRIHSQCLTGDVFGSSRCDCGDQLHEAMKKIDEAGKGIILYMSQEGRGIGLLNKIKAYKLQDNGMDTVEANLALGFPDDLREYWISAQMLKSLGVKKINLMTNNPRKINSMSKYGIEIVNRVPIQSPSNSNNKFYLKTKKEKLGHLLKF